MGETAYFGNKNRISSQGTVLKRNPSKTHPWARKAGTKTNKFVWLHLKASKILNQQSKGVGEIKVSTPIVEFAFLAPLAITEGTMHNWGEYESVASRLAQKVRSAAKIGGEYRALVGAFENGAGKNQGAVNLEASAKKTLLQNKSKNAGTIMSEWVEKIHNKSVSYSIPKFKVDTPLYYESSDRRNLTFEVMLIAERDPKRDLIDTVQDIMKFACPTLKGRGGIRIEFPYVFDVRTQPQEWIKYPTLALTACQPTWNAPYIDGYPSSCNLQLTFKDMSPLYRGTIESGSIVRVITPGSTTANTDAENFPVVDYGDLSHGVFNVAPPDPNDIDQRTTYEKQQELKRSTTYTNVDPVTGIESDDA
jgi:hypothetical protein